MNITGMMVYYYFICQRKLWYFLNEINMEQNSELVSIGKIIDETTYSHEKKGIPVERVDDIYVMTEFDFNTSLLNFLSQYGIRVHYFNYYGFYTGTYYPKEQLVSGKE